MMMMTKSMKYILQEILVGDEGIAGDGSLWPTDLLHCDDQTLLNNIYGAGVLYAAKQGKEVGGEFSKVLYDGNTVNNHEMDHHLFLTLLNPEPLLAQILPTSDYWPTFLGACGRMAEGLWDILLENKSRTCTSIDQTSHAFDQERAGTLLLSNRLGGGKLCRRNRLNESFFGRPR